MTERNGNNGKIFGMDRDLVLLLIGFTLTTVVGTFLQNRSWEHQHRAALIEAERTAATSIARDLSRLMDKRLYRTRRVIWGLEVSRDSREMKRRRSSYSETVFSWNENLNLNLALVEMYFGGDMRNMLDTQIHAEFEDLSKRLLKTPAPNAKGRSNYINSLKTSANRLNDRIAKFHSHMIKRLRDGKVGRFNLELSK